MLFTCDFVSEISIFFFFFRFRKGEAVFRSDNMSTISVLKEVLSKITAQRKMQVRFSHGMYVHVMMIVSSVELLGAKGPYL